MSRFRLEVEAEERVVLAYGHDQHLGFWIQGRVGRRLRIEADRTTHPKNSIATILQALVETGVVSDDDVNRAQRLLQVVSEISQDEDVGVIIAAEILSNLRSG